MMEERERDCVNSDYLFWRGFFVKMQMFPVSLRHLEIDIDIDKRTRERER
jgi:hypothetical protein